MCQRRPPGSAISTTKCFMAGSRKRKPRTRRGKGTTGRRNDVAAYAGQSREPLLSGRSRLSVKGSRSPLPSSRVVSVLAQDCVKGAAVLGRCWRPTQKRAGLDTGYCQTVHLIRVPLGLLRPTGRTGFGGTACPSTPPLLCWCQSFPAVSATVALSRTVLHVPDSQALTRPGLGTTEEAISAASIVATPLPQCARSTRRCPPLRNTSTSCHLAHVVALLPRPPSPSTRHLK